MKQKKTKKNAFKDEEIVKMRDHLQTTREKAIFEVLLSTGCRVSELVQIKLDDFQDDNSIIVHGKGQKDRYVYMNANAKFAYQQYMNDRKDNSIWLFPRMISIPKLDLSYISSLRLIPFCLYKRIALGRRIRFANIRTKQYTFRFAFA